MREDRRGSALPLHVNRISCIVRYVQLRGASAQPQSMGTLPTWLRCVPAVSCLRANSILSVCGMMSSGAHSPSTEVRAHVCGPGPSAAAPRWRQVQLQAQRQAEPTWQSSCTSCSCHRAGWRAAGTCPHHAYAHAYAYADLPCRLHTHHAGWRAAGNAAPCQMAPAVGWHMEIHMEIHMGRLAPIHIDGKTGLGGRLQRSATLNPADLDLHPADLEWQEPPQWVARFGTARWQRPRRLSS